MYEKFQKKFFHFSGCDNILYCLLCSPDSKNENYLLVDPICIMLHQATGLTSQTPAFPASQQTPPLTWLDCHFCKGITISRFTWQARHLAENDNYLDLHIPHSRLSETRRAIVTVWIKCTCIRQQLPMKIRIKMNIYNKLNIGLGYLTSSSVPKDFSMKWLRTSSLLSLNQNLYYSTDFWNLNNIYNHCQCGWFCLPGLTHSTVRKIANKFNTAEKCRLADNIKSMPECN